MEKDKPDDETRDKRPDTSPRQRNYENYKRSNKWWIWFGILVLIFILLWWLWSVGIFGTSYQRSDLPI